MKAITQSMRYVPLYFIQVLKRHLGVEKWHWLGGDVDIDGPQLSISEVLQSATWYKVEKKLQKGEYINVRIVMRKEWIEQQDLDQNIPIIQDVSIDDTKWYIEHSFKLMCAFSGDSSQFINNRLDWRSMYGNKSFKTQSESNRFKREVNRWVCQMTAFDLSRYILRSLSNRDRVTQPHSESLSYPGDSAVRQVPGIWIAGERECQQGDYLATDQSKECVRRNEL